MAGGDGKNWHNIGTFGIEVPQGHIEVLEAAAENLEHVGHTADQTGKELRHAARVDGWEGSASAAYARTITDNAKPTEIAERELPRAAAALRKLADDLRHARHATKRAIEAATTAFKHQQAAERDATEAHTKATNAHAEVTALQGVIDGAASLGDPAHKIRDTQADIRRSAVAAAEAVAGAKRRAAAAARHLEEAQSDGNAANRRYDQACEQAAKVLQSVAAAAPHSKKGDGNHLTWDDVEKILALGKPGDGHVSGKKLAMSLVLIYKTWRWVPAAKAAEYWKTINPAVRALIRAEKMPTWNNGLFGKGLQSLLAKAPGMSKISGWLGNASKATPYFRALGAAGSALSFGEDIKHIFVDDDFDKDPAAFVSDVAKAGFDASSTAFFVAPNPYTAGAVVVTGLVWGATEVWDHWDEISDFASDAADEIGDVASDVKDTLSDGVDSVAGVFGL